MGSLLKSARKILSTPQGVALLVVVVFILGIVLSPILLKNNATESKIDENFANNIPLTPTPSPTVTVTETVTPPASDSVSVAQKDGGYTFVASDSSGKVTIYTDGKNAQQVEAFTNNIFDTVFGIVNSVLGLQRTIVQETVDQVAAPVVIHRQVREARQDVVSSWIQKWKERATAK